MRLEDLQPDIAVRGILPDVFMADRRKRLLALIEQATGTTAYVGTAEEEGQDIDVDEGTAEAELAFEEVRRSGNTLTVGQSARHF
jgi:hypothetical protein